MGGFDRRGHGSPFPGEPMRCVRHRRTLTPDLDWLTPCTHLRTEPAAQAPFISPSAREIQPALGCTSFKRLPRFGTGEWPDWPRWAIAGGSVGGTESAPGGSGEIGRAACRERVGQ